MISTQRMCIIALPWMRCWYETGERAKVVSKSRNYFCTTVRYTQVRCGTMVINGLLISYRGQYRPIRVNDVSRRYCPLYEVNNPYMQCTFQPCTVRYYEYDLRRCQVFVVCEKPPLRASAPGLLVLRDPCREFFGKKTIENMQSNNCGQAIQFNSSKVIHTFRLRENAYMYIYSHVCE